MRTIFGLFLLIAFYNKPQGSDIKDLHFLTGTWKMENKNNYETWELRGKDSMKGCSYKIINGSKVISENLVIKVKGDKILYTATVVDQINGKPIDFIWNKAIHDKFSFENLNHDFPKKIQYTKVNDTTIFVNVLGANEKGFSYKIYKQ